MDVPAVSETDGPQAFGRELRQRLVELAVAADREAGPTAGGFDEVGCDFERLADAARAELDPVEAAQMTGHSLDVWARHYARSFGKPQRDEARARLMEHGFGADESELRANGGANGPAFNPLAQARAEEEGSA